MSQVPVPPREEDLAGVFIGADPLRELVATLGRVAAADANCLIWGESGTGKNLFAYLSHRLGPRRDGPYVELSGSALPEALLETELFGYVRGAFTGAAEDHEGRLVKAHEGTLVLDELDCLSPASQSKLLRVVEQGRFTPMGATTETVIRTRFIGLLQEPPERLVQRGILRQELYYRLALFTVAVPPLRQLIGELPALAEFLARQEAARQRVVPVRLAPTVLARLQRHSFPGNIRELQNLIRRWTLMQPGQTVVEADLPSEIAGEGVPAPGRSLAEMEREQIRQVLRETGGRIGEAAQVLGIHRKTLLEKRKKYGLL
jgi:DNA-binding NtrC family response regulator